MPPRTRNNVKKELSSKKTTNNNREVNEIPKNNTSAHIIAPRTRKQARKNSTKENLNSSTKVTKKLITSDGCNNIITTRKRNNVLKDISSTKNVTTPKKVTNVVDTKYTDKEKVENEKTTDESLAGKAGGKILPPRTRKKPLKYLLFEEITPIKKKASKILDVSNNSANMTSQITSSTPKDLSSKKNVTNNKVANEIINVQDLTPKTSNKTQKMISTKKDNNIIKEAIDAKPKAVKKPQAYTKKSVNNSNNSSIDKSSPDTNNNPKNSRPKRTGLQAKLQKKQLSPKGVKNTKLAKRLLDKSLSFRVLDDKKSHKEGDVYEFTFDPDEEPTPQKKKRKRPVKKRPPKPKTFAFKSNYDDNITKALKTLKSKIKPLQTVQSNVKSQNQGIQPQGKNHDKIDNQGIGKAAANPVNHVANPQQLPTITNQVSTIANKAPVYGNKVQTNENQTSTNGNQVAITTNQEKTNENIQMPENNAKSTTISQHRDSFIASAMQHNNTAPLHSSNYKSVQVEDIAADFDLSQDSINYSPLNSPYPPNNMTKTQNSSVPNHVPENQNVSAMVFHNDPLNLKEGTSFFEDPPIASSSMNISTRQVQASPWRVEFGSLPMKWHNNTYIKPNMTPAVECSFVNSETASKKKHVYTNLLNNEPLPEIFDNPAPTLKQTSIISFIKEVCEKSANKKKRRRSPSPAKANAIFEDITSKTAEQHKSTKKAKTCKNSTPNTSDDSNISKDKENCATSNKNILSPQKNQKKDKDCTYFGFDDTVDQENISPIKQKVQGAKLRSLRSRNILKELNAQPSRAVLPVNPKSKVPSSTAVEQIYDQLKSTEDAQLPVAEMVKDQVIQTDVFDLTTGDDSQQSVHLFEDIELIHHLKPHRKSYGKAKKVTFIQPTDSDSDSQPLPVTAEPEISSEEDDLADLSFHMPEVKEKKVKKKKPKKKLTRKEEKEAEEWAAGFNSMCEDIDQFDLLVE